MTGGASRVFRGGSWDSSFSAYYCRSAFRFFTSPGYASNGVIGFRVVLAPVFVP